MEYLECPSLNKTFRLAKDNREWRMLVFKEYRGKCAVGFKCKGMLDPHHIIYRSKSRFLSLIVENGIVLCRKHHNAIHSMSKEEQIKYIEIVSNENSEGIYNDLLILEESFSENR